MVARIELEDGVVASFKKANLNKDERIIELRNPVPGDTDSKAAQIEGVPYVVIIHPNGIGTTLIETGMDSTSVQNRVDGQIRTEESFLISGKDLTQDIRDREGNILATVTHIDPPENKSV